MASEELPEGWAVVRLSDVANMRLGKMLDHAKNVGSPAAYLRNVNVRWFSFDLTDLLKMRATAQDRGEFSIENGDLLVCEGGEPGRCAVWKLGPTDLIFQKAIHRIRPNCGVSPTWLALSIKHDADSGRLEEYFTGSGIKHLTGRSLATYTFPLPPLAEQPRLVAKIDELLKHVNASRERLAKVPKILKAFRQSVLAAACSGRLTEDWREEHSEIEAAAAVLARIRDSHEQNGFSHGGQAADPTDGVHTLEERDFPESWRLAELKWLCTPGRPITYGILKPGPDYPGGVPYIRVADFPNNRLEPVGIRRTSPEIAHAYRRSALKPGDVLLSIRGTAGRTCRVPEELHGANITQDTARISVHDEILADYIESYLQSPSVQKRFQAAMKGVAVRGVNIGDVRVLQVAVPPVQEQHEIVRRVEILFQLADKIEKRVEAATKRADKLTQSVLAKAFRGELVPTEAELARREGRGYESASVLLERIKAQPRSGRR